MTLKSVKLTNFKRPLIIAHREYRAEYPENTLASFSAALDIGVQMIELDAGSCFQSFFYSNDFYLEEHV